MTPVLFDLESQSAADLRVVGGRNYAKHESTRILCMVALIDGTFCVWIPGQDIGLPCYADLWPKQYGAKRPVAMWGGVELPNSLDEYMSRMWIAHNCHEFDEWVWREKIQPVPESFGDTIHGARASGLPAGLGKLGKHYFGFGKDSGNSIMRKLMTLDANGHNPNTTPGNIAAVTRYCIADVVILERVYRETWGYGEHGIITTHREINARGIQFDGGLARKLVEFANTASAEAMEEVKVLTDGALHMGNIRSIPQVRKWLEGQGLTLPNLRKETVDQFIEHTQEYLNDTDGSMGPETGEVA